MIKFPLTPSEDDYAEGFVHVECAGASTTSAGSWSLGTIQARQLPAVSKWLTNTLNEDEFDSQKKKKPKARYLLVHLPYENPGRDLSVYGGPDQRPFSEDIAAQRSGLASPFKFKKINITKTDRIAFQDVCPINILSMKSFRDLQKKMLKKLGFESNAVQDAARSLSPLAFRPNIIVDGDLYPYEEELWANFTIKGQVRGGEELRKYMIKDVLVPLVKIWCRSETRPMSNLII